MTRKILDCRTAPSESNCTLTITGAEDEVLAAGTHHAVTAHGHADGPDLRRELRADLADAPDGASSAGAFVQVIEFETDRLGDWDLLQQEFLAALGTERTTRWSLVGEDRDRPGTYVAVVEFPGYDDAMANSAHPGTTAFAQGLAKICTSGPSFRNLDVRKAAEY